MLRNALLIVMLLSSAIFAVPALAAGEPTLHEVYQAAEAGKLNEALGMMDKVVKDHPTSAKAHFVRAELLARMGRIADAAGELNTADRIAPGLPFAKPQSVEALRERIVSTHGTSQAATHSAPVVRTSQPEPAGGIPWGLVLLGLGAIAVVVFIARKMTPPVQPAYPPAAGSGYGTGFGTGTPMQPAAPGGPTSTMGQPMMGQPGAAGMGSGILGGLATGAALGAGMVAGQALMHRFTDGEGHGSNQAFIPEASAREVTPNDMGGADFGVSDSSSWDDSSSGGGGGDGDWN